MRAAPDFRENFEIRRNDETGPERLLVFQLYRDRRRPMRYLLDFLVNRRGIVQIGGRSVDSAPMDARERIAGERMVLDDGRLDQRQPQDQNRGQQRSDSEYRVLG